MIKKLSKYGNSFAIVIDKPILEELNIDENTHLKVMIEKGSIILEPLKDKAKTLTISKDPKLQNTYEELVEKYDAVLKKLAKN